MNEAFIVEELTQKIIGAAIEVHWGAGLVVPVLKDGIKRLVL